MIKTTVGSSAQDHQSNMYIEGTTLEKTTAQRGWTLNIYLRMLLLNLL